jgi:predicted hotdog family 3-hydroxylacyl-ACP dehydratase
MAEILNIPALELVPHRPPMLLIDSLIEAGEDYSICTASIRLDSVFLGDEGVPAITGIEYMAQAVAAHGGYLDRLKGEAVKVGFLLGSPSFKTHVDVLPLGSLLRIHVKKDWGDDQMMRFCCKLFNDLDDQLWQECDMNVYQPNDLRGYINGAKS